MFKNEVVDGKYAPNFVPLRMSKEIQAKWVDADLLRGLVRTEKFMENALLYKQGSEKEVTRRLLLCQEVRGLMEAERHDEAYALIFRYAIASGILGGGTGYPPLIGLLINYMIVHGPDNVKNMWHALAHRIFTKWSWKDRISAMFVELSQKIATITVNAPRIKVIDRPVVSKRQLEEVGIELPVEISLDIVAIRVGDKEYEVR